MNFKEVKLTKEVDKFYKNEIEKGNTTVIEQSYIAKMTRGMSFFKSLDSKFMDNFDNKTNYDNRTEAQNDMLNFSQIYKYDYKNHNLHSLYKVKTKSCKAVISSIVNVSPWQWVST